MEDSIIKNDKANDIEVSVYCLAYNHGKYIRDALEAFVSQETAFKYEVIVHDDASTDNTADIIREYAEKYPDIIKPIFQTENQYSKGVRISETYIFPLIRGKYIAICEGDDYWTDKNKLQKQVDFLNSHPDYVACTHNTKRIFMNTDEEEIMYPAKNKEITLKDVSARGGAAYHTSSLMYRVCCKNLPQFSTLVSVGDYPLSIHLALSGKIMFFGEVMSVYRYGIAGSWTVTNGSNNKRVYSEAIEMLKAADEYSEFKHHKEFCDAIAYKEYQLCVLNEEKISYIIKNYYSFYQKESFKNKIAILIHSSPILLKIMGLFRKGISG